MVGPTLTNRSPRPHDNSYRTEDIVAEYGTLADFMAATALYFDVDLHTSDKDFDHLAPLGLRIMKG